MASVSIENVRKSYGALEVVHGLNVEMEDGYFIVLVGPSGCGKSTLLRMIAGLETITSGTIRVGDRVVNDLAPKERDIAMVFQNYALYPHMTVYQNMGFSLKIARRPKSEISQKVGGASSILDLDRYLERKPVALSGGQRQRVAMGRAIVRDPKVFLFDEPLSNLDAKLRVQMRSEIRDLHRRLGTTTVYVTHDQTEAMTMADKIVVLNAGRIEQVGSPLDLYRNPVNLFVAGFIGSPHMNIISGPIAQRLGAETIGIRPEHLLVSREGEGWEGVVAVAEHLGSDTFLYADVPDAGRVTVRTGGEFAVRLGETVRLNPMPDQIHRFQQDGSVVGRS
ncbi:sugar ABC transporter ATP-binding protein [Labrys miyagiensis]|uniref:Sugar ABC transporter ATP-binding protein n=1 Tax=Labrys miyagiensis TaxID=346912 RepID=A0ABQ6CNE9_9HYPH|nr:sn-glycerol-3-phosphate ABC transporter ATP-binding protein UgpC [Labrys miyagiensis]GLS21902.1 sugar ABC transporter ATP-binding protein [Labrys miyagiensis]